MKSAGGGGCIEEHWACRLVRRTDLRHRLDLIRTIVTSSQPQIRAWSILPLLSLPCKMTYILTGKTFLPMNLPRAIVVHVLAAALLVVGFSPCPRSILSGKAGGQALASCAQRAESPTAGPVRRPCCCSGSCDGKCCGMACCRRGGSQQQAPPASPHSSQNRDQRPVLLAFADVPAMLSGCQSVALLRSSSISGSGSLPALTLQSQDVRIQT